MNDKKTGQTIGRNTQRAALVEQTAKICGCSKRYVRYVLAGDRENETVFSTYMMLSEESNKLLNAVKELVPFN